MVKPTKKTNYLLRGSSYIPPTTTTRRQKKKTKKSTGNPPSTRHRTIDFQHSKPGIFTTRGADRSKQVPVGPILPITKEQGLFGSRRGAGRSTETSRRKPRVGEQLQSTPKTVAAHFYHAERPCHDRNLPEG